METVILPCVVVKALKDALEDCIAVIERDLQNPEVAQPECRQAKEALESLAKVL